MSKSQRTKGAAGEREWCEYLRAHGYAANRELSQTRDGGGDVIVPPVLYEVKRRGGGIAVRGWLEQATVAAKAAADVKYPVVACREDGNTEWMVVMRAQDFLDLLAQTRTMGWHTK